MAKNSEISQRKTYVSATVTTGAVIGGILGAVTGFLDNTGVLDIPVLGPVLTAVPVDAAITGAVLGALIGGGLGALVRGKGLTDISQTEPANIGGVNLAEQVVEDTKDRAKMELREERLDITKKWIQTGDVSIRRETYTEEKTITVPVTREELIIEKRVFDTEGAQEADDQVETIRIPLREEQIQVNKHMVVLEDVEIYRKQFQEIEHIEEVLKKEKIRMETTGDPKIIEIDKWEHS